MRAILFAALLTLTSSLACSAIPRNGSYNDVPVVQAISPAAASVGAKNITVKVTGRNLDRNARILWNGTRLSTSKVWDGSLVAQVPNSSLAAPGTAKVAVQNSTGATSDPVSFTISQSSSTTPTSTTTSPVVISTATLSSGTAGQIYSASLAASGGTAPYTFSLDAGAMPAGMVLTTTGSISGTPTQSGTFNITVRASDSGSPAGSATKAFAITIAAAPIPVSISTATLPAGTAGTGYSASVAATGGTSPYSFGIASGTLPAGVALSTAGGFSGTPSQSGTFNITVRATDSASASTTKTFAILIAAAAPDPVSISTASLPSGTAGTSYSASVAAAGGKTPYSFSVASGTLPTGVAISTTGAITGKPSTAGTYNVTLRVTDAASQVASKAFSIAVAAAAVSGAPSPQSGDIIVFQDDFESGNLSKWDEAPSRYAIESNPGYVASGTKSLRGTVGPNVNGQLNKWYMPGYDEQYVKMKILFPAGFQMSNRGLHFLLLMGNRIDDKWSASGKSGIRPNGTDFFISNLDPEYPSLTGGGLNPWMFYSEWPDMVCPADYNRVSNTNCWGNVTYQNSPKEANVAGVWQEVVWHLKTNTPGQHDGIQEVWINGKKNLVQSNMRWRDTTDVKVNELSFNLYMPDAPQTEYVYVDDVMVWSPAAPVSQASSAPSVVTTQPTVVTPAPALSMATTALPGSTLGLNYAATIAASGGTGSYTFGIASGALPSGLSLSATTGQISGAALATGTYNITFKVSDSGSPVQTATKALSLTVAANPVAIATSSLVSATSGSSYSATLAGSGGVLPYTWTLSGGSLPSGLSLNSLTGVISGKPTASGNFNFSVQATDVLGQSGSRNLALTVSAPATIGAPLFSSNLDSCAIKTTSQGGEWYDFGNVSISDIRSGGKASSPNCSARSGNSPSLISRHNPMQELWGRERVYLSDGWVKPAGGAAHFWRFWRDINPGSSASWEMIVDQIDGGDNLAIGFMPQAGTSYAGGHGEYWLPISISLSANRGRWMCWEVHLKMNTPGQSDGVAEFYLDGQRLLNATGLNQIGNGTTPGSDNRFQHVNWMSNVGGNSNLWPGGSNYWMVDDVAVGTERVGCQ